MSASSGLGLRHLDRLGFADDRELEGQDRGEAETKLLEKFHELLTTDQPSAEGPRQAGGVLLACAIIRRA